MPQLSTYSRVSCLLLRKQRVGVFINSTEHVSTSLTAAYLLAATLVSSC